MKFFGIKIGETFFIEEKVAGKVVGTTQATKTSALGYMMPSEQVLGEHSIDPTTDSKIVTLADKTPPATAKAARPFPTVKPVPQVGKAPSKGLVASARAGVVKAATKVEAVVAKAVTMKPAKKAAKKTAAKKNTKK
jgi:hypothetical protein